MRPPPLRSTLFPYTTLFRSVNASSTDIANKVEAGQLDMWTGSIPPSVLKKYATSSNLKQYFHQNSGDRTWYLTIDRKSTRLNSSHRCISYAVFCLKKKKKSI